MKSLISTRFFFFLLTLLLPIVSGAVNAEVKSFEHLQGTVNTIREAVHSNNVKEISFLQFGYTQQPQWIRFKLPAHLGAKSYVVTDFRCLDYIDFYIVHNKTVIDSLHTGYLMPLASRELAISSFVKSLPESDQHIWVYLRLQKNEGSLRTRVFIKDEQTLNLETAQEHGFLFFFLGVCFLMLIFAVGYFIYFRLQMFLWYVVFVVCFAFHQVSNMGYGSLYIWGDNLWLSNAARVLWIVPGLLSGLWFAYSLLRVKEFCPAWTVKFYKVLVWVMLAELLFIFLPLPAYPWRFGLYTFHVLCMLAASFLFVYSAFKAVLQRYLPGYLFLAGEMVLLLSMLAMVLRNYGIVSTEWVPDFIHLYVGIPVMSLALFSMIAYTRQMHVVTVKEEVLIPFKPEPKLPTAEERESSQEVFNEIESFFKENEPYLDAALKLELVSQKTGIPAHRISKAINLHADKHFSDYVNFYRIEKAKQLLKDAEAQKLYTIEGIAQLCGFANKASFNKAFKKFTGQTPSEFRDKS